MIQYEKPGEFVESVRMFVPSYLHAADVTVDVAGVGRLVVDIAYGGNYYAVVEPQDAWPGLDGISASEIVDVSVKLRDALADVCDAEHPDNARIKGVHHALWCDTPTSNKADAHRAGPAHRHEWPSYTARVA